MEPTAHKTGNERSSRRRAADAWAPKLALAGRYRKAAKRHNDKAANYLAMAQDIEAEIGKSLQP